MDNNRYSFNGTSIGGYWEISDKLREEHPIWIDCEEKLLPVIISALNAEEAL